MNNYVLSCQKGIQKTLYITMMASLSHKVKISHRKTFFFFSRGKKKRKILDEDFTSESRNYQKRKQDK